tara:strand:- start:815 stop:1678 length:864 start_codon:yes stop_codon:yes gene_type:complete
MARKLAEFGVLNIVANPHPDGTYINALTHVSGGTGVNFWGDQYAAITSPREAEDKIFSGRIVLWTKIDEEAPAINLKKLEEVPIEKSGANLPIDIGFNGKIFSYYFNPKTHILIFEIKNEFDKRLSPLRCEKIFELLLSPERLPDNSPLFDVTTIPEDDTVEKILSLPKLRKIAIHLKRPNPDDVERDVQSVLDDLQAQGAKSQNIELVRAPKFEKLNLNAINSLYARVAASNGYVEGIGQSTSGEIIKQSTKQHPKTFKARLDEAISLTARAVRIARDFRIPPPKK